MYHGPINFGARFQGGTVCKVFRPKIVYNQQALDVAQVVALYSAIGWNQDGFRTAERVALSLAKSLCYVTAYADTTDHLIGYARLVGDGIFVHQLVDVIVDPEYRGQGLARSMVSHIMEHYFDESSHATVMLVDGSGVQGLYSSMGFLQAPEEGVWYQSLRSILK